VDIAAICTAVGAIIAGAGGILLAIRAARSKERQAAASEIGELGDLLDDERKKRIECEVLAHQRAVLLAKYGITDAQSD
jgi:hypothetical protein